MNPLISLDMVDKHFLCSFIYDYGRVQDEIFTHVPTIDFNRFSVNGKPLSILEVSSANYLTLVKHHIIIFP